MINQYFYSKAITALIVINKIFANKCFLNTLLKIDSMLYVLKHRNIIVHIQRGETNDKKIIFLFRKV